MRIREIVPLAVLVIGALSLSPLAAVSATDAAQGAVASLLVKPHAGAEAIDVSGHAQPGSAVMVTLVSTFDRDVPDVVLSRTPLVTNAGGDFSAVIPIAPGYTRGSIITVYVTSTAGGPASTARYLPDAPNRGVVIPFDDIPKNVR